MRTIAKRTTRIGDASVTRWGIATLILSWSLTLGSAQAADSHVLELSDAVAMQGQTVSIQASYSSADTFDTIGWSFGVRHDPLRLWHEATQPTPALLVLSPEYVQIETWAFGWTADVVLSFDDTTVLPAGSAIELFEAQYRIEGPCTDAPIPLVFTDELGFPATPIAVDTTGGPVTPRTSPGFVTTTTDTEFWFVAPHASIPEGGTRTVSFSIWEEEPPYGSAQGFSLGIGSNPVVAQPVAVAPSDYFLSEAGGSIWFFQENLFVDGWSVGVVFGHLLSFQFPEPTPMIEVTYEAVDGAAGLTTPLALDDSLGTPPVDTIVVVNGQSMDACGITGSLTVTETAGFLRGDSNADGVVDLADPVMLLVRLFSGGSASTCVEADDVNDDGSVDLADPIALLHYVILGATPPSAPSPECGFAEADLGCEEEPCP